jgi:hypothetical protein
VKADERDWHSPSWKFNDWEKRGVPLRIRNRPEGFEKNQVAPARRDTAKAFLFRQEASLKPTVTMLRSHSGFFARRPRFEKKAAVTITESMSLDEGGFLVVLLMSDACEVRIGTKRCHDPLHSHESQRRERAGALLWEASDGRGDLVTAIDVDDRAIRIHHCSRGPGAGSTFFSSRL